MAPMDDLYTAINMFKNSVNDLTLSRAVMGANEQVQQIKASEASEQEKRAQLTALSQQLVAHMGAIGAPVDQIQTQAQNIVPHFANANAMNVEGVMTGNKALQDEAQKQQAFEQNPAYKMQLLQAKMAAKDPLRMAQFQALQDERFTKHMEGFDKRIDTQTARFGNIAKLQGSNNRIADALSQIEGGNIDVRGLRELAKSYDSILSQGASTVSGTEHLEPHTRAQMVARAKEWLTNKPENIYEDVAGFTDFYKKAFTRIKEVNEGIIKDAQKNVIKSLGPSIAKQNPSMFADYVKNKTGEDVKVDPKTGKMEFLTPVNTAPQLKKVMAKDRRTGQMVPMLQDEKGQLYNP